MILLPVPLQEQPAVVLLLERVLVSWSLAMDERGGHEDLRGSGRRSVIVTSPRLNRINSILIPLSCNFFSGSPPAKNSVVKRAWPGAIS